MAAFRKMQTSDSQATGRDPLRDFELAVHDRSESTLTWEQVARALRKRKRTFFLVASGIAVAAAGVAFAMRDVYRPVARLEIDPVGAGIKTLHEIENPASGADPDYLETQSQVLQSDALAMRVIRGLHLAEKGEFASAQGLKNETSASVQQSSEKTKVLTDSDFLQEQASLAEPTAAEAETLKKLRKNIYVMPVRSSRLVEVSAEAHDPQLAKSITNLLVTQYIDQNYRNRYVSTMEASEWLSSQLSDLRQRVADSNQAVADYQ